MKGFLIDIDGVLKLGDHLIDGAAEFIEFLNARGIPFVLVTNNSTRTPEEVARNLGKLGLKIEPLRIITSAVATGIYLKNEFGTGHRAYVIGENGLKTAVKGAGWKVLPDHRGAEFVVVGLDRSCDYFKITEAIRAILMENATFVASNDDRVMPSPEGPMAGAGTIVTAIKYGTGVEPVVIGKPGRFIGEIALQRLKESASGAPVDVFVIGDRPETDIKLARNIGARGILVLTGVTNEEQVDNLPPEFRPDEVVSSVKTLIRKIEGGLS